MALSNATNVDARGSNFIHIGRDHVTIQQFNITITSPEQLPSLARILDATPAPVISDHYLRDETRDSAIRLSSEELCDIAIGTIVKITQLLIGTGDTSCESRRLKDQLDLLQKTLILTGLATQVYLYTPLSQNLRTTIERDLERSCNTLKETLDYIRDYHNVLQPTSISYYWRQVLWSSGDEGDSTMTRLRVRLSSCQRSLGVFLAALNSYVTINHTSGALIISSFGIRLASHGWKSGTGLGTAIYHSVPSTPYYNQHHLFCTIFK